MFSSPETERIHQSAPFSLLTVSCLSIKTFRGKRKWGWRVAWLISANKSTRHKMETCTLVFPACTFWVLVDFRAFNDTFFHKRPTLAHLVRWILKKVCFWISSFRRKKKENKGGCYSTLDTKVLVGTMYVLVNLFKTSQFLKPNSWFLTWILYVNCFLLC